MGLFDFLSGADEAEAAAAQNRANLAQYGAQANDLYNQYQGQTLGALGTGYTNSLNALSGGLESQLANVGAGITTSQQGLGGAIAAGTAGVDAYKPLSNLASSYQPAVDTYYSALGITDPSLARNSFQTSPGYQFSVDEALKGITNKASAFGNAQSGNTLQALGDRAQNIFLSQEWNPYLDRLQGFVPLQAQVQTNASQGTAAANANLANIYNTGYGNVAAGYNTLAGLYGQNAGQVAGLENQYASDQGNVFGNVASGRTQAARDVTTGNIAANNQIAQAGQQDAANLWGLIGAGTKAVGSAYAGGR